MWALQGWIQIELILITTVTSVSLSSQLGSLFSNCVLCSLYVGLAGMDQNRTHTNYNSNFRKPELTVRVPVFQLCALQPPASGLIVKSFRFPHAKCFLRNTCTSYIDLPALIKTTVFLCIFFHLLILHVTLHAELTGAREVEFCIGLP
jgi:hypothetical protein